MGTNRSTLLFVHGTGVRGKAYAATLEAIKKTVDDRGLDVDVKGCFWGESEGAKLRLNGVSIPDYLAAGGGQQPSAADEEVALWSVLYTDPLYELRLLRNYDDSTTEVVLGEAPPATLIRDDVERFTASDDLTLLLESNHLMDWFPPALQTVASSPEFAQALDTAPAEPLLHRQAIARAIVAQTLVDSMEAGNDPVSGTVRDAIVEAVTTQLHGYGMGISDFLLRPFKGLALRYATYRLTKDRGDLTDKLTDPGGDIMRFLARGDDARRFLEQSIQDCGDGPVILLAHSLGGIMCADLLVRKQVDNVDLLITVGSQAPFLYEIGALPSLEPPDSLPDHFPRWLNVYDRRDLLSYVGAEVFPERVSDLEVDNGQPFPYSHSAYWSNPEVWAGVEGALNGHH
ncbi:alpha/beta fold hydrolase [Agromyces mariniharenae]|uniref:Alpha/beta hydrolase n=1 Tax=Agromyces mariniharenae TaxID=2604423 RepID=A0A5S4V3S6_9MICO|nr:alpha/beta hydrolase [Agromyces mariniharenae]TYL51160.1 alpha/beta hydrolase [Agromyces mariniharenae]